MRAKFAALFILAALWLTACGKAAVGPAASHADAPPTAAAKADVPTSAAQQADAQKAERPVFWPPLYGTEVYDLRSMFPAVIPSYLPERYGLQLWSTGMVSSGEKISGEDAAPVAVLATLYLGPPGKTRLVIMESSAALNPPDSDFTQVTKNASGSELSWSDGFMDGEPLTHVLFKYDDINVLATGVGMPKEEVTRVVASMKMR